MSTWPEFPPASQTSLTFTSGGRLRRMRALDPDQWVVLDPDRSVEIRRTFAGGFVVQVRRTDGGFESSRAASWSAVEGII